MRKLITSLLATCMCLGIFCHAGTLTIRAEENLVYENSIIETRESDWPEYNYGGWMDVAANPQNHQKVIECIIECIAPHVGAAVAEGILQKILSKGFGYAGVGVTDAFSFVCCVIS